MVEFITQDPVWQGYQRAWDQGEKQRLSRESQGVDAAARAGMADSGRASQTGYSGQTQADATDGTADLGLPATGGNAAPPQVNAPAAGSDLGTRIGNFEDPSGRAINAQGYTGRYQMGKAALQDVGMYTPAAVENMRDNAAWGGMVTVPGFGQMTREQFANNLSAQNSAYTAHMSRLDTEIQSRGLTPYVGRTINGVPITPDTIKAMMHFGGVSGAEQFLKTGGQYNPADANGVTLSAYALRTNGGGAGTTPPPPAGSAMPDAAGAAAGPLMRVSSPAAQAPNYQPVIDRLAQTPGGGRLGLSLMGQQGRNALTLSGQQGRNALTLSGQQGRFGLAQQRQETQQLRLLSNALMQGDSATANFLYGQMHPGGQLPPQLLQDAGSMRRFGVATRLAGAAYRNDPEGAATFTSTFMRTGNVDQAYAASPPRDQRYSLQWMGDAQTGTETLYRVSPGQGTATPVTSAPTAPTTGAQPAQPGATPAATPPAPNATQPPAGTTPPGAPPPPAAPGRSGSVIGYSAMPTPAPAQATPQAPPAPSIAASPAGTTPPGAPPVTPTGPQNAPGQPLQRSIGGGGRAQEHPWALRQRLLLAGGYSDREIADMLAGRKQINVADVQRQQNYLTKAILGPVQSMTPRIRAEIEGQMNIAMPGWRDILQGRRPGSPSAGAAPPVAQRQPNAVYNTPRGPMRWTGTGWLPAQ